MIPDLINEWLGWLLDIWEQYNWKLVVVVLVVGIYWMWKM